MFLELCHLDFTVMLHYPYLFLLSSWGELLTKEKTSTKEY